MYEKGIIGTCKHSKIKVKILLENVYEHILFRSTTKVMVSYLQYHCIK